MKKFEALHQHLESLKLVSKGKLDAWVDTIKPSRVNKTTIDGLHLCDLTYTANFSFEDCTQDPTGMFAIFMTWLFEHDASRRQDREGEPNIDGSPTGCGAYNMGVEITFVEELWIHQAENGPIEYLGQRWDEGKAQGLTATAIQVAHD